MQALSDEQRIDSLEKKMDEGFTRMDDGFSEIRGAIKASERGLRSEIIAVRADARSDFRTMLALVVALWAATVLTVLAAHL
jgi:hypothetical protein